MEILKANDIGRLLETVRDLMSKWNPGEGKQDIWFRGVTSGSYELVPTAYRPENSVYASHELGMLNTYRAYLRGISDQVPSELWDLYFFAQHYGHPTRLLDWTESLSVALFFALVKYTKNERTPAIWVLEPNSLNLCLRNHDSIYTGFDELEGYKPILEGKLSGSKPVAILAPWANRRVAIQQGRFTLHGQNKDCIHKQALESKGAKHLKLAKIELERDHLDLFFQELELLGTNLLSIFPEVHNVAAHLKNQYLTK